MQITEDKKVDISLANYRLAFDAMRAYHTSEIEHKKDMITIQNQVLLSIISVFAGIFYFILSPGYKQYHKASIIVILLIAAFYFFLICRLNSACIRKIKSDNKRYEQFRIECNLERDHLGISKRFDKRENIYWSNQNHHDPDHKPGFKITTGIITVYSEVLLFVVATLTLVSLYILINQLCNA